MVQLNDNMDYYAVYPYCIHYFHEIEKQKYCIIF